MNEPGVPVLSQLYFYPASLPFFKEAKAFFNLMECYLLRACAHLREIFYNLSLFLFSDFTTFLWNRYSHPLMIYFLVVKKDLNAKISARCIPELSLNAEIQNWRPK